MNEIIESFVIEANELGASSIDTLLSIPTPIEFSMLAGKNRPAIFRNLFKDTFPVEKWKSKEYIVKSMGDSEVSVSITPDGLADSIHGAHFMLPFESRMNVGKVLDLFGNQCLGKVHYIQSQNDNMHNEWSPLMRDIPESLSFAQFLGKPDACNIWIGDKHAKTSLHKDHYENIYIVVAGMKHFTIYPPTDYFNLDERVFDLAEWHLDHNDKWSIKDVTGKRTPWLQESKRRLHPVHITLGPGDGLYLPSLWFHKVHQEEEQLEGMKACIAVNYWYDMDYSDARFSYFELIRALKSFD